MTITSQLRRAAGSLLSVLGPAQKKRAHDSSDDEGEEGVEEAKVQEQEGDRGEGDEGEGEEEEKDDVKVVGDDTETNHPRDAGLDPRCMEQWDKYMMPIDLGEIEAELEAAASSGRITSRVSMETCRFVISIFRNDGPGAKGGWGSFVWYASKMDRNIRFLNKTWPTWRTRLYLDDSVPATYVHYLRTELNVEVINVQHLRKGLYRDYLLPSVRPLVIDDPTVSRFVSFDCHDELTDSSVTDWVTTSQFNNPRAQTRALFTYWWVEMGPDNPPGAHCHINHIDYDPTTRAHPPPQDEKEGLQDFMHRHIDAGAWGMIGGQGLFRASTAHLQQYLTDRLIDFAHDTRIRPGHEEVLMDLTLGKLMRCRRRFVGLRPAFTGCTDKVEASEAEVREWKDRFGPHKEEDINWATGPRASAVVIGGPSRPGCVVVDGEVDLTALGLPRKECSLTAAYMEQCWADNRREKVIERARAAKGQSAEPPQAASASQQKSTKRARRK